MTRRELTEMQMFRAQELLMARATVGLSDLEAAELADLGADDDLSFDLAAAAIDIATLDVQDLEAGLPPALADKVLVAAGVRVPAIPTTLAGVVAPPTLSRPSVPLPGDTEQWATGDVSSGPSQSGPHGPSQSGPHTHSPEQWGDVEQRRTPLPGALTGAPPAESGRIRELPAPPAAEESVHTRAVPSTRLNVTSLDEARAKKRSKAAVIGWVAAAACAVLAAGAWLWATQRETGGAVVADKKEPTPAEARAELLASAKDAATLPWTATPDPAAKGATGDVVWSASAQRGYMRFVNLAPNNPTQLQYQLWIFDKDRDEKFPVDGGVFNVSASGEVIVPISAKLRVTDATLFAVTVEKPGGVVVSKRERIVVTAAPRAS